MEAKETIPATEATPVAKSIWRRGGNFVRELWNDHDFWIRALAIKGGAAAIVVAGLVGISYVLPMAWPIATVGVAACGGLISLGLSGIFLGVTSAWDKLRDVYSKTISSKPLKERMTPLKTIRQKILETSPVQKLLNTKLAQKLSESRIWQTAKKLTKKHEDIFLASLVIKGSLFSAVVGALIIAPAMSVVTIGSIMALPIIIPTLPITLPLILPIATALTFIGSAIYGGYLGIRSLVKTFQSKKSKDSEDITEKAPVVGSAPETQLTGAALTPAFKGVEEKPAKDKEAAPAAKPLIPPPAPSS